MHLFSRTEQIATRIPALIIRLFPHYAKTKPLIKRHSEQTIIVEILPRFFNGFVSWVLPYIFFAYAFAAASISHKVSPDVFCFFNCERKMSISGKKCVSLNLSLQAANKLHLNCTLILRNRIIRGTLPTL